MEHVPLSDSSMRGMDPDMDDIPLFNKFEDKIVRYKKMFSWVFIIMTVVILIMLFIIFLLASKEKDASAKVAEAEKQGFNTEFNQMNFAGLSGDNRTKEDEYNNFGETLMTQGFDPDPRPATNRRFDANFSGRAI